MARYRRALPQLGGDFFLMDGGLETTLVFHHGIDLPCFAAFDLLKDQEGRQVLRNYFDDYLPIAKDEGVGFILESVTWRASADWGARFGSSKGLSRPPIAWRSRCWRTCAIGMRTPPPGW
jgi:homocysteine S-methyltransferase